MHKVAIDPVHGRQFVAVDDINSNGESDSRAQRYDPEPKSVALQISFSGIHVGHLCDRRTRVIGGLYPIKTCMSAYNVAAELIEILCHTCTLKWHMQNNIHQAIHETHLSSDLCKLAYGACSP